MLGKQKPIWMMIRRSYRAGQRMNVISEYEITKLFVFSKGSERNLGEYSQQVRLDFVS